MKIKGVEITQKYINRLNSKIRKITEGTNTGCHETVYAKNEDGYSKIIVNGKRVYAHRLMYQIHHPDEDIDKKQICHTCDNPGCVNPDHLFSGTMQDNMTDKVNKGRQARGSKSGKLKLTEEDIVEIIHRTLSGDFTSCKDIASYYNIHVTIIRGIINQQAWIHVTKDFDMDNVKSLLDKANRC